MLTAQLIDNFIFQPIIYSTSIKAHPLEIFIVLLMAGQIGGTVGMLVAIPASGAFNLFSMRTNRNEVFYTNFGSHALAMFKRDELAAVESVQAKGTAE